MGDASKDMLVLSPGCNPGPYGQEVRFRPSPTNFLWKVKLDGDSRGLLILWCLKNGIRSDSDAFRQSLGVHSGKLRVNGNAPLLG